MSREALEISAILLVEFPPSSLVAIGTGERDEEIIDLKQIKEFESLSICRRLRRRLHELHQRPVDGRAESFGCHTKIWRVLHTPCEKLIDTRSVLREKFFVDHRGM